MIISPNDLRRDLVQLIKSINDQIKEIEIEAEEKHIPSAKMRDSYGNFSMTPLLLAKAQAYGALVRLNDQARKPYER